MLGTSERPRQENDTPRPPKSAGSLPASASNRWMLRPFQSQRTEPLEADRWGDPKPLAINAGIGELDVR
jgi:hypothetical protein